MKTADHAICTFLFANGTAIRVAVPAFAISPSFVERSYETMYTEAKRAAWNGDETNGRGPIRSFTVGDRIIVGEAKTTD